jgi:hypothetical protein
MITGKINVKLIDKGKLYVGQKGTYLDFVLIPTPDNQYGDDYMIVQQVSKEEREAGKRGAVLGNAKILAKDKPAPVDVLGEPDETDSLPF